MLSRIVISNLNSVLVEEVVEDKSYGKAGRCGTTVLDAMMKSHLKMYGSQIYYFNGQIYKPVDNIKNLIYKVVESIDTDGKLMTKLSTIINNVLTGIAGEKLEVKANLICFKNCVFDISTETVHDFSPELHVISQLEYDYKPEESPSLWLKFLKDVLGDDESILLLQEFLGLIFVDRKKVKIETMLFCLGSGANGKSVVFDTVIGVLGSSNVRNYEITALTNSSDRGKNLMDINGKLLNYCSEISSRSFSSSSFKSLISGEPQQARPIYGEPAKVEDIPLMMANANTMPSHKDTSNGVFRRIVILPFNKTIPDELQDKNLSDKMKKEYSGIMNWILDGRRSIAKKGYILHQGKTVRSALSEYRQENNSVYQFVESKSYSSSGKNCISILAKELYQQYLEFCDLSNIEAENPTNFGRTLRLIGFIKERTSQGIIYKIYE